MTLLDLARVVTDFADQAVILPVIGTVALVLLLQRRWHTAAGWVVILGAMLGTMLVLKIVLHACGWQVSAFDPDRLDLRSPSGHTAAATAVAGGLLACLGYARAAVIAAVGVALVIGATRLMLGAHSETEVMIGAAVGIAAILCLVRIPGPERNRRWPVAAAAGLVAVLLHGYHLPAEAVIQGRGSAMLRTLLGICTPPAEASRGFAPARSQDG